MCKLCRSLGLTGKDSLISVFGSAFLAFGLYNVHALSGVTEGGVLGLTLLLDRWFSISPSVSGRDFKRAVLRAWLETARKALSGLLVSLDSELFSEL